MSTDIPPSDPAAGEGMPPVRVVFFDAGETILSAHPTFQRRFAEVAAANGATFEQAAVDAAYADAIRRSIWTLDWGDAEGQERFWKGFYSGVLADLGYTEDVGTMAQAMFDAFSDPAAYRLFPDTLPVLDELEARGIAIGVISNFEPWLREVLRLQGIHDRLVAVSISGELRVAKPEVAIFEHALDAARVRPEEAVHVGDSLEADVVGARAAGIAPVLIDRFDRCPTADCPRITALPQLFDLLEVGGRR